jgi:hypothetical protein
MHEYEHGQLKSGPEGKGGKVKGRRQAIAIALSEAGASKYQSKQENKERLAPSARNQPEQPPSSKPRGAPVSVHVGSRASTPAMGGESPSKFKKGDGTAAPKRKTAAGASKKELYNWAKAQGIEGRSKYQRGARESARVVDQNPGASAEPAAQEGVRPVAKSLAV